MFLELQGNYTFAVTLRLESLRISYLKNLCCFQNFKKVFKSYYKFFWTIRICITTDNSHIWQPLVIAELLPPLPREVRALYRATQTGQARNPEVSVGVLLTLSSSEPRIIYMVTSLWTNRQRLLGRSGRISALETCGSTAYAIQSNPLETPGNILALHVHLNHSLV